MEARLQVTYQNGEMLVTQLHPLFFTVKNITIATRALDIAHAHNPAPWKIVVYHKGEIRFQKTIDKNAPLTVSAKQVPQTSVSADKTAMAPKPDRKLVRRKKTI